MIALPFAKLFGARITDSRLVSEIFWMIEEAFKRPTVMKIAWPI
jgi:hypothetical protein